MPEAQLTLFIAFVAGMVSFASPCCLPLVPAYITQISGVSLNPGRPSAQERFLVLSHAILFVLGFSLVFIVIWGSVGFVGYLVQGYLAYIRLIGGSILVFLGFHTIGVWRVPFLDRSMRLGMPTNKRPGYPRSFLTGIVFAAGWAPCIGTVLAGIIGLASLRETVWQGSYLLVAYSAGLAIPFLAVALAMTPVMKVLRRTQRYQRVISVVSGLFLIIVGFLLLTNMFIRIPKYFYWGAL